MGAPTANADATTVIGALLADPQQAVSEACTVLALVRGDAVVDKGLTTTIVNLVGTILTTPATLL